MRAKHWKHSASEPEADTTKPAGQARTHDQTSFAGHARGACSLRAARDRGLAPDCQVSDDHGDGDRELLVKVAQSGSPFFDIRRRKLRRRTPPWFGYDNRH